MHPLLSIGAFLLIQLIQFLIVLWFCRRMPLWKKRSSYFRRLVTAGLAVYLLFSPLPIAGAMLPDSRIKFFCQMTGNILIGFALYFGLILLLLWIPSCAVYYLRGRKRLRIVPGTALLLSLISAFVLLVYGMLHAQDTIVTKYDLTIDKEAGEAHDLKVVLIADLHLSVNSYLPMISRMVDTVNAQKADVCLVAGDIFTSTYRGLKDPEKYAEVLSKIDTVYGTYAVYGNHDVEETLFGGFPISPISKAFRTREMEQFFEDCHFHVLYDETETIADGNVQIVGRVDGEKAGDGTADRMSPEEVLSGVDRDRPVIVLQHEPVEFKELKENGADLAVCGHTHAGQIFPGNLIVPLFNENAYGYKNVSGLDTIVTSGIGYYGPPMRIGTDSEITVIDLHFR